MEFGFFILGVVDLLNLSKAEGKTYVPGPGVTLFDLVKSYLFPKPNVVSVNLPFYTSFSIGEYKLQGGEQLGNRSEKTLPFPSIEYFSFYWAIYSATSYVPTPGISLLASGSFIVILGIYVFA